VDEKAAVEKTTWLEPCPATSACGIGIVVSGPGELHKGVTIPLAHAVVDRPTDRYELKFTEAAAVERNVRRLHKVEGVNIP